MKESLVYIDFNKTGYFTLLGGVKIQDFACEKIPSGDF